MATHQLLRGRAKLGAVSIGGGATIKKIDVGTFTLNPADNGTSGTVTATTFTLTGVAAGDIVLVSPPAAIEAGVTWSAFVSAADTVTVRTANLSGGDLDIASATWSYVWIDRT